MIERSALVGIRQDDEIDDSIIPQSLATEFGTTGLKVSNHFRRLVGNRMGMDEKEKQESLNRWMDRRFRVKVGNRKPNGLSLNKFQDGTWVSTLLFDVKETYPRD